jgi:DNA invertase Pin-like site-specific DNA recombinase
MRLSMSGKRPRFQTDRLLAVKLDRLGRSTRDVLNLVHDLEAKGAALTVLEPTFSTKDTAGPILVTVLGMVAEMERKLIRERQQAGIEAAKAKAKGISCSSARLLYAMPRTLDQLIPHWVYRSGRGRARVLLNPYV